MPSTSSSIPPDPSSTHLPPSSVPPYLRHLIVQILLRKGFDGAEAGALGEIERLLERHVETLLETARDYANLSGRREVHAGDVVTAQESRGWGVKGLKKETKRRRTALGIKTTPSPPPSPSSLDPILSDILRQEILDEQDLKPHLTGDGEMTEDGERRLNYAPGWIPSLPHTWTFEPLETEEEQQAKKPAANPPEVTGSLLDFIKLTAAERGDIPPELGLVDYRREREGAGGKRGAGLEKRKWGLKGTGA
ncbi:hypothetical protein B9479_000986 [Cryptococcus floricola]|uniref:Bromodomain associated domain-containing protein n=1 Tax=Cryptococcus floricola TaxID=2591691 RepID=A0A5D3B5A9_9TREE|nr:hypothetical protein B9479_000986 [Cryptococcus floricola]